MIFGFYWLYLSSRWKVLKWSSICRSDCCHLVFCDVHVRQHLRVLLDILHVDDNPETEITTFQDLAGNSRYQAVYFASSIPWSYIHGKIIPYPIEIYFPKPLKTIKMIISPFSMLDLECERYWGKSPALWKGMSTYRFTKNDWKGFKWEPRRYPR